jgi:MFS family permease
MRTWFDFFKSNKRLIIFGLLLTFCSGFGQTFLLSLYVPEILEAFNLTNSSFGSVYALSTIISAISLTWAGRYIDNIDLKKFASLVAIGLSAFLLIFSTARNIIWLGVGLWGLRLFGQGLMSHTSVTSMSRYFDEMRGKAISISNLGHPAGQALLPVLIAVGIQWFGWRQSLTASAVVVAFLLPSALFYLLRDIETNPAIFTRQQAALSDKADDQKEPEEEPVTYRSMLGSKVFWSVAPGIFALPFLNTAFFFYQIPLVESRGWATEWVAASFSAYAVASALSMLAAGQWVDKISAARLFPFYLLPFMVAMLMVTFVEAQWIIPLYLIFIGISSGLGSTIKSALLAEVFGITYLGTVRSLFAALMVISTALGPAIFGFLLDAGLSFEEVFALAFLFLLFTVVWSFRIVPKVRFLRWYRTVLRSAS